MSSGPQIVRIGRTEEAESVLQHLDDAGADDLGVPGGELLENGEHELLLAHRARVLDLEVFGKGDELGRSLGFQVLKLDFPHRGTLSDGKGADRGLLGAGDFWETFDRAALFTRVVRKAQEARRGATCLKEEASL